MKMNDDIMAMAWIAVVVGLCSFVFGASYFVGGGELWLAAIPMWAGMGAAACGLWTGVWHRYLRKP